MKLPSVIAHRGDSGRAPENTLAAIRLAAEGGATWVELDANVSSDGIVYIHHDDVLDRCTDGTGFLLQKTSKELDQLDAGSWFGTEFAGEPLPRLAAVISLLKQKKLGLNLEIKPSAGWEIPTATGVCDSLLRQWPDDLPLLVSSFSDQAVAYARDFLPATPRGLIVCAIPPDWRAQLERLQCQTIHCAGELLTENLAREIRQAGYGVLCWTVNSTNDAKRLLDWGVDSVFTDFPTRQLRALG